MRGLALVTLLAAACSSSTMPDAGAHDAAGDARAVDAAPPDAPAVDAGADLALAADLGSDLGEDAAALDAGAADAGMDAGPPPACDVVAQTGCAGRDSCRYSSVGGVTPGMGPPACESSGFVLEGRTCMFGVTDDCATGFFCSGLGCHRYCDPAGAACPDLGGSPQACVHWGGTCGSSPIWLCLAGAIDWGPCP